MSSWLYSSYALLLVSLLTSPLTLADANCRRDRTAEDWLSRQGEIWHPRLIQLPGYEKPERVTVCRLERGTPRAIYGSNLILLRETGDHQDRITLAHEYLHLSLQHHPSSRNERFIEKLARKLILEGANFDAGPE
jgi:uncharacterized protein YfaQ (DUF2300 family)